MAEDFAIDAVLTALAKAGPAGLSKEELEEESALGKDDLRSATEHMRGGGLLSERDGRFYGPSDGAVGESVPGQDEAPGEEAEAERGAEISAEGTLARAQILTDVTFRLPGEGDPEAEAVEGARALATDIPNLWPTLDAKTKLGTVEIFEAPRRVWPREDDRA